MLLYFAYGSNMSPAQMAERCPGSQLVGPGSIKDWRFLITKRGTANIVPTTGHTVYGALWRCTPRHLHSLDKYEGVAWKNYLRRFVTVTCLNAQRRNAVAYWSPRHLAGPARVDYLTTALLPGASAIDLPKHYVASLRQWLPDNQVGLARPRYKGRKSKS